MTDENKISELTQKIKILEAKVQHLQKILDDSGIEYDVAEHLPKDNDILSIAQLNQQSEQQGLSILPETITSRHASYFFSFFKGRQDLYSKRSGKPNKKTVKHGYYTQCWNFWKDGICPKKTGMQIKCGECKKQNYKALSGEDIFEHLIGKKEDCSDVIGIYPMLVDETCNFIVFDFDNHDDKINGDDFANTDNEWIEDVNAMRNICKVNEIDALVERSRSGKGAHVWMFFEEPIAASTARKFGSALLTKGAESINQKSFKSYDRMIPAQDHMPEGGVGNLVALPLQGQALKRGNSAFIDEHWNAIPNQWRTLTETKKLTKIFVEEKVNEWSEDGILGTLSDNMSGEENSDKKAKPWKKEKSKFYNTDVDGSFCYTVADQIYIETENLRPRIQNQIRRLAAYSNPEFYKNHAMGFGTQGIPRIVSCSRDQEGYICIPRGCEERLLEKLMDASVKFVREDARQTGKTINVSFKGELYPEQRKAVDKVLQYENGILGAATAFGKTAVGAYLVVERKVNTLILVHNTEIMNNWMEDLEKFLDIEEELPEYKTASGRIKKRKSAIGTLKAGRDTTTGIIDIVMISSLGKNGDINELVKNYGMTIMDECHHGAAQIAEEVLSEVSSKYVYGLTATPKRDDGQEQKIYMQFGPIRYRYTAKDRAKEQGIEHFVYPRFTRLVSQDGETMKINDAWKGIVHSEVRNEQILSDVRECIEQGRSPLVMTRFIDHAAYLYEQLKESADHIFLLQGGKSAKERNFIREKMKNVSPDETVILVAIGKYIGEGFNYPRLDTLLLATPIAYEGVVEQYSGRLHRDYEGKEKVIIYDYVDSHIRVLEKMYHKRLRAYKKIGYELTNNLIQNKLDANAIFDTETYYKIYEQDLLRANSEVIISSPGLNEKKVTQFVRGMQRKQESGIKVTVITLEATSYPENRVEKASELISYLKQAGVVVKLLPTMHEHFALIDKEIVWYGSMNLLSGEKGDDNLMRVVSKEIVQELMAITFGRNV